MIRDRFQEQVMGYPRTTGSYRRGEIFRPWHQDETEAFHPSLSSGNRVVERN